MFASCPSRVVVLRYQQSLQRRKRSADNPFVRHASSEGSLFAPGGAPKADREHRRLYRWTLLALCTLLVGIVASAFGDGIWQSYVRTQQTQASKTAAAATSETLTSALQRDADFTGTATTLLTTTPGLTNRALASWFDILNARARYPGAFGLTYLEVVPQDRLAQFAVGDEVRPSIRAAAPGSILHHTARHPGAVLLDSIRLRRASSAPRVVCSCSRR